MSYSLIDLNINTLKFSLSGGSGFLGQNLVKLLQECDPLVKEIRVLDLKEYENKIGE